MPALILWEDVDGQTIVNAAHPLPVALISGGGSFSDVNLTQIGGVTVAAGNGLVTAGTLRVTIASDSTGQITVNQGTSPWVVDTELPAAATLADTTANPTTTVVGAFLQGWNGTNWDRLKSSGDNTDALATSGVGHLQTICHLTGYNGATWDRLRSSIAQGLEVDVTRVQGTVTVAGTVAVSGTVAVTQSTSPWVVSGTVAATQSGTWTVQPGNTANTTAWLVTGTGGTFPVTDSGGSLTVDNGGTFAVQAAQSGTWNIGTVTTVSTVTAVTSITNPVSTKTALTASAPTAATVGTSSAQAVAANANRKGLVLINTSANTISFGLGATAVLNSGITIASGFSWTMDEYTFTTAAINAIASAITSNLSIQEFTT